MVKSPITPGFEVGSNSRAQRAKRPQKMGYRLVETSIDLDTLTSTTFDFIYCTSSSNVETSKFLFSLVLLYVDQ